MSDMKLLDLSKPTALLAIGLMLVILVMVLPVPAWVLDLGLTASFAFAILIFTTSIFIEKPLDFSSFPSVLLASLILRLALNVSSTKLIISEGHSGTDAAGGVIEGFAMFIMGGNLFVGLVVFGVLIIVNFMVITKGAGRMAEVGARFALDAMPGKQLAIDSDLAVGAISHEEARQRRQKEQEEAGFLGSLDGASKFVKGDAIAGLLITALNLIAGIGFGVAAHGLSIGEAAANYSVLTVGDGLVSQIPAVIVSVSAALLLSKGRDDGAIDEALGKQLGGNATALMIVAGLLLVFALFPGLPFLPFMAASAGFGIAAFYLRKQQQEIEENVATEEEEETKRAEQIGDSIHSDEIHLEVAPDLVAHRGLDVAQHRDGHAVVDVARQLDPLDQAGVADQPGHVDAEVGGDPLDQVVALGGEEQVVEQRLGSLQRGRIAWAQTTVDLKDRLVGGLQLVRDKRVTQERSNVQVIDEQNLETGDSASFNLVKTVCGNFVIALNQNFSGIGVDNVR